MPKITQDTDNILDLEAKKKLLHDIHQEDLLDLFKKDYKSTYKPITQKKSALDQSVGIAITTKEKEFLQNEMKLIKRAGNGGRVSLSSVMRHRVLVEPDIQEWKERAKAGLKEFDGPDWNKAKLTRQRNKANDQLDNLPMDDKESRIILTKQLTELNAKLAQLQKPNIKRNYRLRGRVTFNEANTIRWRAGRLNITVADYMRMLIFGYLPFSDDDKTMSFETRKRFYVSILDVAINGWGNPPQQEVCPDCLRYQAEIRDLKEKLNRLTKYAR